MRWSRSRNWRGLSENVEKKFHLKGIPNMEERKGNDLKVRPWKAESAWRSEGTILEQGPKGKREITREGGVSRGNGKGEKHKPYGVVKRER